MKCAYPGCRNVKTLQVGVCLKHWAMVTIPQRDKIQLAWIDYQLFSTEDNYARLVAAKAAAFRGTKPLPPSESKRAISKAHTKNWEKTARRQQREGLI
jgi:hypothetical protein